MIFVQNERKKNANYVKMNRIDNEIRDRDHLNNCVQVAINEILTSSLDE